MGNLISMLPRGFFPDSSPTPGAASSPTPGAASSPPSDATSSPTPDDGVELAGVEPRLSTGQAARRRRKRLNRRQRERADIGASSSGAHELNAATPDANPNAKNADPDAKNADSDAKNGHSSSGAHEINAATLDANPNAKNANSDAKNADSSGTPGLYAARTAASSEDASSKGAADPKITEPASMGIGFLHDASSVADHDGLHGAALAVAATSTDQEWTTVPEKKSRAPPAPSTPQPHLRAAPAARFPDIAPRAPAAAAMGQQRPLAAAAVGLLDDLEGGHSFFGNLFEEELDEDQLRAEMHRGYVEACSTLKKKYIYCLPCFLSEDKKKQIVNSTQEISKHMRSDHKGVSFTCAKSGCFVMATNRRDISHHELYAHQM